MEALAQRRFIGITVLRAELQEVHRGNVVGSSDQFAAYPRERPVHVSELSATIFHLFGVDPRAQLYDITGQFRTICDGNPVQELF